MRLGNRLPRPGFRIPTTGKPILADVPGPRAPVEIIPTSEGDVSATASAYSSFLYCNKVAIWGVFRGIVSISRIAQLDHPLLERMVSDKMITAHLRMSVLAAASLRHSLNEALLAAAPAASEATN